MLWYEFSRFFAIEYSLYLLKCQPSFNSPPQVPPYLPVWLLWVLLTLFMVSIITIGVLSSQHTADDILAIVRGLSDNKSSHCQCNENSYMANSFRTVLVYMVGQDHVLYSMVPGLNDVHWMQEWRDEVITEWDISFLFFLPTVAHITFPLISTTMELLNWMNCSEWRSFIHLMYQIGARSPG